MNAMPDDPIIREITTKDAAAAARLTGELGYAVSVDAMQRRIECLRGLTDRAVYVACLSGEHHLRRTEPRALASGRWPQAKVTSDSLTVAVPGGVSGEVVGWIDVSAAHHLQSEPLAEIGGLVVASEARSGGIGRRLVERAEEWAVQRGLKSILVRSQVARAAAHRFYLREGYERIKTSAVFTKKLA
jgi:GNAT superfamily N-acetyltransferase